MADRKIQTPGTDSPAHDVDEAQAELDAHTALVRLQANRQQSPDALNNCDMSAESAYAEREAKVAGAASAELMARGKFDEALAVLEGAKKRIQDSKEARIAEEVENAIPADLSRFGPDVMAVSVNARRRSKDVDRFGRELPWPEGTPLNAQMLPCEGNDEIYYHVGRLLLPHGWVIGRALPVPGKEPPPIADPVLAAAAALRGSSEQKSAA